MRAYNVYVHIGLKRLAQLYKTIIDKAKPKRAIQIESLRIVNTTGCHDVLRRLDRRAPATEKHFIVDMSTLDRLQAVMNQVNDPLSVKSACS